MTGDRRSPKTATFQRPFPRWVQRLVVAATAGYAALLVFATHYPKPEELTGGKLPPDKLLHFGAYGLLGLLAALVLRSRGRLVGRFAPLLGMGLAAWCVIDEASQPYFGRHADPLDWVYDVLGLAVGIGVVVAGTMLVDRLQARRAG